MTPLASLLRICNLMTLTLCIYGGEIRIRPGHEHIRNDSHPSSGFSQRRLEDRLPPTTIPINFNILGSGMFKKKMEFGWRPGSRKVCHRDTCCWSQHDTRFDRHIATDMRLSRDPYRRMTSSRLGRLCRKRAKGDTRDQDTCCRAIQAWIIPNRLYDPVTEFLYEILQLPDYEQGYYGVLDCSVRSCSGSCRKAVTAMTFLVISHDYSVDLKTFDVPTYCVCN